MEKSYGKIGTKEYAAIIFIVIAMKLTDDTPSILFQTLQNTAWMAPLINGIIVIIPFYLLVKVITLYEHKNLLEVIRHLFGKYIGFIVLAFLWFILFCTTIISSAVYTDTISTMYFPKTPTIIIYSLLMAISAFGAKKGIETLGSVARIVFPFIQVALIASLILTLRYGQLNFLFPILGPGAWPTVKESAMKLSIYMDLLYLSILIPFIRTVKDFKKGTWIAMLFIVIQLAIAIASYIMLFDYKSVKLLNFPYHEVIRFIYLGFLTNIETFFFPFWIVSAFLRFAVYLYICALLFGSIFKIKQFEFIVLPLATIVVFLGMIPDSPPFTLFILREKLLTFSSPIFFFFPCLLWILAKIKGDLRNEKAK